jgi:hypothetical protein
MLDLQLYVQPLLIPSNTFTTSATLMGKNEESVENINRKTFCDTLGLLSSILVLENEI